MNPSSATTNLNAEKEELMVEVESLSQQLEESQAEVKTLSDIVDNYELKLRLIAQDKDVTIDNLNRALATQKEDTADELEQMRREVEKTVAEMKRLKEEVENEIHDRDERIFGLQQALTAHKDLVEQMKTEMDHLQGSMETTAVNRREEIEDMQQELVELTSTVAKQERQIKSLLGEIEDRKVQHGAEIEKLRKEMESLEATNEQLGSRHRTAEDLQTESRLNEVKDRLDKLRWKNNMLQEENAELRRKLASDLKDASMPGDEAQNILQEALNAQAQRVKELEAELSELKKPLLKLEPSQSESLTAVNPVTPTAGEESAETNLALSVDKNGPPPSPSLNLAVRRQRGLGFLSRGRRRDSKTQQN
jgi:chromosome segregation ATPase